MKSDPECIVCLMKQALNTARFATEDQALHREILNLTAKWTMEADLDLSPAAISTKVYRIVSQVTGVSDPYEEVKKQTNLEALKLLPDLKAMVANATDPLDAALHLAVAGNIIDMGIGHSFDLKEDALKILNTPFAVDHTDRFKYELKSSKKILYLGDNSGEIVFDRILVEQLLDLGKELAFAVKSGPIINDAMMEDAKVAGLTELLPVIETGSDDIGVCLERAGKEFLDRFESADLMIAKGHGNFESLNTRPERIFFLLKAKCPVVAAELGVLQGDIVFKSYSSRGQ